MTTTDVISPDLKTVLRRLKLSRMLDTLPERLTLARQQKMPHQDLLLQVLSDEVTRRDSLAVTLRVQKARLDPTMRLEPGTRTAKVTFDRALLNELASLRFLDAHAHVTIVGPVGVGKTFLAHALGHIACRRGATVLAVRTDQMLKTLKHARLDNSYEAELRKLIAVDLAHPRRLCHRRPRPRRESRPLRPAPRALSHRLGHRHLESRPGRMARHLCRSRPRPERHRSLHQQRLRPGHRGRIVSAAAQTTARQGREGALAMTPTSGRASRGGARRQPLASIGARFDRRRAPAGSPIDQSRRRKCRQITCD